MLPPSKSTPPQLPGALVSHGPAPAGVLSMPVQKVVLGSDCAAVTVPEQIAHGRSPPVDFARM